MPFEGNRGSSTQSTTGQRLGAPIYQWGAANPYGPYSGLPGAGKPAGGSTTTAAATTPAAGPNEGEAWYKSVLSGGKLPFNPATKANMVSRASDMTAAAEGANNQRNASVAAAGGASANDPSYQAAQLANQASRQTANQTAVRDIDTEAEKANFGAEAEAANALNQNAMQRESYAHQQANQANNQAMSFLPWNQSGGSGSSGGNNFKDGMETLGGLRYRTPGQSAPYYSPR